MELNAEQKKCPFVERTKSITGKVEFDCETCPASEYDLCEGVTTDDCVDAMFTATLALINSHEQKIKELTEQNERLIVTLKMNDAPFPEGLQIVHDFCEKGKRKAKADTVREMVAKLDNYFVEHNEIKYGGGLIHKVLKQVAKEMLDGNTASDNKCVVCGDIIPEGRQVCPNCEEGHK